MAPQATELATTPPSAQPNVLPSATPSSSASPNGHRAFVPAALLVLLCLCLALLASYSLYRYLVVCRKPVEEDDPSIPPDRGVAKFMNGSRLTLNFGNQRPSLRSEQATEPKIPASESYPVTLVSPTHPVSSRSSVISTPATDFPDPHTRINPEDNPPQAGAPHSPQSSNAKSLSHDRVAAITADPKLAPVQGPLRPLSMHPSPSRAGRLLRLFSFGAKSKEEISDQEKAHG
ncbi:hypothetical protein F5I97DRAFT_964176 [Phlebopus sp. FC_14]|nr:hypothetical protein F5I97DRAFT_964176 [Phlebopus sp. FC_14]